MSETGTWDGEDRRASARYAIAVPVELGGGTGMTHDISVSGLNFETATPLAVGARFEFTMLFERRLRPDRPLWVACTGRVVRVRQGRGRGKGFEVGAAFERIKFGAENLARRLREAGDGPADPADSDDAAQRVGSGKQSRR